jgi:hypothetical protein
MQAAEVWQWEWKCERGRRVSDSKCDCKCARKGNVEQGLLVLFCRGVCSSLHNTPRIVLSAFAPHKAGCWHAYAPSSVSSSSLQSLVSDKLTAFPATECASLNGTPCLTRWSLKSVASIGSVRAASILGGLIVRVDSTPVAIRTESLVVVRVSNNGSLSSCRSWGKGEWSEYV